MRTRSKRDELISSFLQTLIARPDFKFYSRVLRNLARRLRSKSGKSVEPSVELVKSLYHPIRVAAAAMAWLEPRMRFKQDEFLLAREIMQITQWNLSYALSINLARRIKRLRVHANLDEAEEQTDGPIRISR